MIKLNYSLFKSSIEIDYRHIETIKHIKLKQVSK